MLPLEPSPSVFAWRVAIRLTAPEKQVGGGLDPVLFRAAFDREFHRQLAALGVAGRVTILGRKPLCIKGQSIVSFSVQVDDLSEEDSLKLQAGGIGGKRKMGCGVFCPTRKQRTGADNGEQGT